ncbi:MAG: hypothetical protein LBI03_03830 [Clostridiales bacterium]|jgi:hypothetical protein|nr:hypothetical protein [Clostridiales bacterium]
MKFKKVFFACLCAVAMAATMSACNMENGRVSPKSTNIMPTMPHDTADDRNTETPHDTYGPGNSPGQNSPSNAIPGSGVRNVVFDF